MRIAKLAPCLLMLFSDLVFYQMSHHFTCLIFFKVLFSFLFQVIIIIILLEVALI